jgi:hypothetical protein
VPITIAGSEPELDESTARFITRANVLTNIQQYAINQTIPGLTLVESEARHIADSPVHGTRTLTGEAERLLRIAWQTELAARVSEAFDDPTLRRVAAQTLPVQAYYSVFNAARALTMTAGSPAETHAAMHNDFESQRARVAAGPWAVTLSGDPEDRDSCQLDPPLCPLTGFNPMELGREPEEYLATGLRMTRRWKADKARDDWLRQNKKRDRTPYKRLPAGTHAGLVTRLRRTTLMDLVYELRRRTNYESVDEYGSDARDGDVQRFHDGLLYLTRSGLLLYETQLAQYVGIDVLATVAQHWTRSVARVGPWAEDAVTERLEAIAAALRP